MTRKKKKKNMIIDRVIIISIFLLFFFAFQDYIGWRMWQKVGGWQSEAYIRAEPMYLLQFWTFAYVTIGVIALTYYLIIKDKTETLALITTPSIR